MAPDASSPPALAVTTLAMLLLFGSNALGLLVVTLYSMKSSLPPPHPSHWTAWILATIKQRRGDAAAETDLESRAPAALAANEGEEANNHGASSTNAMLTAVDLHSASSVTLLSRKLFELSLILLYSWICEFAPMYAHASKIHDLDFYYLIMGVLFFVACFTLKLDRRGDQGILNRDQSEEWRGMMQVIFLLYHVFKLEEVYSWIRVFISCYVFLTGFGNTSFFYIKRDYSAVRVIQMLWRLGMTAILLCLVHDNPMILYYIVPLHTFYFFMAFITMYAFHRRFNHTKYGLRVKLMVLSLVIYLIWEIPAIFNVFFFYLPDTLKPGAPVGASGVRYEWQFRSGLDHWSAFFGMVFAAVFPQMKMRFEAAESSTSSWMKTGVAIATGAVFVIAFFTWYGTINQRPKLDYNSVHPYFFVVPMFAYLFLRNATPGLRTGHLHLFAEIGKITLETYLLQHHIWLTSNAKTVLVFVPNHPKLNFGLVTIMYVVVSKKLYRLTLELRALLLPDSSDGAIFEATAMIGGVVGFFLVLAQLVTSVTGHHLALDFILCGACAAAGLSLLRSPNLAHWWTGGRRLMILFSLVVCIIAGIVVYSSQPDRTYSALAASAASGSCPADKRAQLLNEGAWAPINSACPANTICRSRAWTWSKSAQACGYKDMSLVELAPTWKTKYEFIGGIEVRNVFRATSRNAVPSIGYAADATESMKGVAEDRLTYIAWTTEGTEEFPESPNDRGLTKQAADQATGLTLVVARGDAVAVLKAMNEGRYKRVVLLHTESGAREKLEEKLAEYASVLTPRVDLAKLQQSSSPSDKTDENPPKYRDIVYDVAAQLVLNAAPPVDAPSSNKPKSGAGGGLAHSPILGALLIGLAGVCMYFMDGFLGIHALMYGLFSKRFAPSSEVVTWEASVKKLHAAIGLDAAVVEPLPNGSSPRASVREELSESDASSSEEEEKSGLVMEEVDVEDEEELKASGR